MNSLNANASTVSEKRAECKGNLHNSGNFYKVEDVLAAINFRDFYDSELNTHGKSPDSKGEVYTQCPFHNEEEASFSFNESTGQFYCFGCGRGGTVFQFIQERVGCDFPTALRSLAEQYGVQPSNSGGSHKEHLPKPEFIWENSINGDRVGLHIYLKEKGIKAHGIRLDEKSGCLIVPVYNFDGKIQTIQRILPEKKDGKNKFFLSNEKGKYPAKGGFFPIGEYSRQEPGVPLRFCEGYATGASIYEGTEEPVICCLSSSSFDAVIGQFREKYPDVPFVICSDRGKGEKEAKAACRKYKCLLTIPEIDDADGKDFNDVHLKYGLSEVKKQVETLTSIQTEDDLRKKCRLPQIYADRFYQEFKKPPGDEGLFSHSGQMYFAEYEKDKDNNTSLKSCEQVCDFTFETLFRKVKTETNTGHPEWSIRLRIVPKNENSIEIDIFSRELFSAQSINKTLADRANVSWIPLKNKPTQIFQKIIRRAKTRIIKVLDIIGLNETFYVHHHFLINEKGEVMLPDKSGLFKEYEPFRTEDALIPDFDNGISAADFQKLTDRAWGKKAHVAFAWAAASWFRHDILKKTGFFPFLSIFGDPQSGKSTLIKTLQHVQGFQNEGIRAGRSDTIKGISRSLAQRSGLFNAVIENSEKERSNLDWGFVLTGYNGNSLQTRAKTSNDNATLTSRLLSGVAFVANNEPFCTQQEKERLISVRFLKSELNDETFQAHDEISGLEPEKFVRVFAEIMKHRQMIEKEWFPIFKQKRKELNAGLRDNRIAEVHAVVAAFHDLVCRITGGKYDISGYLLDIARQKIQTKHSVLFLADTVLEHITNRIEDYGDFAQIKDDSLRFNLTSFFNTDFGRSFNKTDLGIQIRNHPALIESNKSVSFQGDKKKAYIFDLKRMAFYDAPDAGLKLKKTKDEYPYCAGCPVYDVMSHTCGDDDDSHISGIKRCPRGNWSSEA